MSETTTYGVGDSSYKAAGELAGITTLVNAFYDYMDTLPEAAHIRGMHSKDLTESRTKLIYFLSGWLGGPKLYAEHFGSIIIPKAHQHLPIGQAETDAWMQCMKKAIADQPYTQAFKTYLVEQLMIPAERIKRACESTK